MADIFISYSRADRELVKLIAERLALLGYSVWWDQTERARQTSLEERERELTAARGALVVWSLNARNTAALYAEAASALDAGKLVQVKLEPVLLPPPFDRVAIADMSGAGEWGPLEHALSRLVKNGEANAPVRALLGPAPSIAASGAPKLVTFALAAVLAAFATALSARFNGVMTPEQVQIAFVGMLGVAGACAGLSAHRLFSIARAAN